jgi:hypothetical protein
VRSLEIFGAWTWIWLLLTAGKQALTVMRTLCAEGVGGKNSFMLGRLLRYDDMATDDCELLTIARELAGGVVQLMPPMSVFWLQGTTTTNLVQLVYKYVLLVTTHAIVM